MNLFPFLIALFLGFTVSLWASPRYPWQGESCSPLKQDNGKQVGSVCSKLDVEQRVGILEVFYYGHLFEQRKDYKVAYVDFNLDGSGFFRKGLKVETFGDGRNLPVKEVLVARYIALTNFQSLDRFPVGKSYEIYFQAEPNQAAGPGHFAYDSNLSKNYGGKVLRIEY